MITEKLAREWTDRHAKKLRDDLGLWQWHINWSVSESHVKGADPDARGFTIRMDVRMEFPYRRANITVYLPAWYEDEEKEFVEAIRHEFLHLHLASFEPMFDFLLDYADTKDDMTLKGTVLHMQRQAREEGVRSLERMLDLMAESKEVDYPSLVMGCKSEPGE